MGMKISDFSNHFNNLVEAKIYNSFPSELNSENFAIPIQTHSCNVKFITQPGKYENVDGLISSFDYKIPLIISVADCVPIYIFDIKTNFYGILHSGWRGTKDKIIKNALNIFVNQFDSKSNDIYIAIGPHIKQCCYEVEWDVAKYFKNITKTKYNKKWVLSLDKEIINDILKFDIPLQNIISSNICTYESKNCHSFRRDGKKSKRMVGILK